MASSKHAGIQSPIKTLGFSKQMPSMAAKEELSANKVMATAFLTACGIIHIDFFQMGRTINEKYNANILEHFNGDSEKKRP